jgi:alkaline phosphatase
MYVRRNSIHISGVFNAVVLTALLLASAGAPSRVLAAAESGPKYIFVFLADGGSFTGMEMARQYSRAVHREGFTITDKIMREGSVGVLTTHAADSITTDSAAAATALSAGCKANIGVLGICADGKTPKTVMEIAREKGARTALVTTSTVYDASPAAFVAHVPDRKEFNGILEQYLRATPDVILGGGLDQFLPKGRAGSARKDNKDILAAFAERGYAYAADKKALALADGNRLLGLFTPSEMNLDLDRNAEKEPSLVDMTEAAIKLLGRDGRSFMAFIENENTDTSGHLTDVASMIHAYRDLDHAVARAYEFYLSHRRDTLILVTSDHDSGGVGFTLALAEPAPHAKRLFATDEDYKKIASIPVSLRAAAAMLGQPPTAESIDRVMRDVFKGFTLAPDLRKMLLAAQVPGRTLYTEPLANILGLMVANNTQAYWIGSAHTNQPVFVAAIGNGAERFRGYQDNTDFAKHLFSLLGPVSK